VEEVAQEHWLEMGMLSVTFTAYTAPNGLTVVDAWVVKSSSPNALPMLTLKAVMKMLPPWWPPLHDHSLTHYDQVQELKQNFMTYLKSLCASDLTASQSAMQCAPSQVLPMMNDGFPILPSAWNRSQYKKQQLEELFILCVGQHYSAENFTGPQPIICFLPKAELANNGHSHHVPFKAIANQTSLFISHEYLPAAFKLRDPWDMHKSLIEDFFEHVLQQ
jgi:hypothetical protein